MFQAKQVHKNFQSFRDTSTNLRVRKGISAEAILDYIITQ